MNFSFLTNDMPAKSEVHIFNLCFPISSVIRKKANLLTGLAFFALLKKEDSFEFYTLNICKHLNSIAFIFFVRNKYLYMKQALKTEIII